MSKNTSSQDEVNLEVASELFDSVYGSRTLGRKNTVKSQTRMERKSTKSKGKNGEKVFFDSSYTWWTYVSKGATCCFPAAALKYFGINRSSQQAWREKVEP
jgi:hypothetical protein